MSVQRSITHYSTQFMYIYLFICRVCNGAQTGTLVLGKLALLVLLTNRFQYIPRVIAVAYEQISIHPTSSCCRARWRTNRFQYIPRVLTVLVGVDDVRQHRRK